MVSKPAALHCRCAQLAGTLVWSSVTLDSSQVLSTQESSPKLDAILEIVLSTSISPASAFEAAGVAQKLQSLLLQGRGSARSTAGSALTEARSPLGGALPETPEVGAQARESLPGPDTPVASGRSEEIFQGQKSSADDLMVAALANRSTGECVPM